MTTSRPFANTAMALAAKAAAGSGNAAVGTATATGNAAKSSIANARLQAFRHVIQSRVSARRFEPNTSVPDRVWMDILKMTMTSPSGFNLQPTHMLLLRSPQIKSALSKHAMLGFGNQYRTNDASAIAVFCADLEPAKRIDRIYEMERESGTREDGYLAVLRVASSFLTGESTTSSITANNNATTNGGSSTHLSTLLKRTFTDALSPVQPMPTMERPESWSYKNAGIAAQTYTMAATAHGLSTCMMEGFDARRAREILRVPERYGIPLMVATGYDYDDDEPVVHADLDDDDDDGENRQLLEDDGGSGISKQQQKRTARLEMDELFFGDTFGEPLDFLFDNSNTAVQLEKENVA